MQTSPAPVEFLDEDRSFSSPNAYFYDFPTFTTHP